MSKKSTFFFNNTSADNIYVQNSCISKTRRLISDILEITDLLNLIAYLVTIDIEKAFDSLSSFFLMTVLKKFGFVLRFLKWIAAVLKNHQSSFISAGTTAPHFKLEQRAGRGDQFLFIFLFLP